MAKPTLALIPASQGSKLFSVLPSSGVGDFDFSRGSAATRINSLGLIENVASGQSRLDYPLIDGVVNGCPSLLLEPQRSNKVTYSEDFSNAYWALQRVSVLSNNEIAPNGTLTATKFTEDISNNTHQTRPSSVTYISIGQAHTFTCFAKKAERKEFRIENVGAYGVYFDLENGTKVEDSASQIVNSEIKELSDGWYKCSVTITETSRATDYIYLQIVKDGSNSYQGDGTSGIYIYGAQLEQGSYPTSYIPNYGTSAGVTRSAETANGAGDATTFNDSEGVLMAEIAFDSNDGSFKIFGISDRTLDNRIVFYSNPDSNSIKLLTASSGVTQPILDVTVSDIKSYQKILVSYRLNYISFWANGFEIATDLNTTTPIGLVELSLDNATNGNPFYGKTKQIQYFQTALTDSELEELTSWESFTAMAYGQTYSIK